MADCDDLERKIREKLSLSEERQQMQEDHCRQHMMHETAAPKPGESKERFLLFGLKNAHDSPVLS